MEKAQPIQNPQYSPYLRGLATGAVAGTLATSALVIHTYVLSGTPIPTGMPTATLILKEISISFVSGVFSSLGTVPFCLLIIGKKDVRSFMKAYLLAIIASGTIGCATFGAARLIGCATFGASRLVEQLL